MSNLRITDVAETVRNLGSCVELVPLDPHFKDITVGLFAKDQKFTIWSYSKIEGAQGRIEKIREQLINLGGMEPILGTPDQVQFSCKQLHVRPLKFLMMQAVERSPDYKLEEKGIKDLRSPLFLNVVGNQTNGTWVYRVVGEGEAPNAAARLRAIAGGMVRYGEMERMDELSVAFNCNQSHHKLASFLLPYARNVSGVENMLDDVALRGQMTTGTLGFAPPT